VEDPDPQADLVLESRRHAGDWEAGRQRYFSINWIQRATTWAALALFLAAPISH
jgi:hypothetical protein